MDIQERIRRAVFNAFYRDNAQFAGPPKLVGLLPSIKNRGEMIIGRFAQFRAPAYRQRLTTAAGGRLEIGRSAFLNDGATIMTATAITIGDHVKIANFATIVDTNFHQVSPDEEVKKAPIVIGNNVWIGMRALVLAGARIGDHSVIAAGSVVRGDIPPRSIAAGTPARVIRTFAAPDDWVRT